MLFEGAQGTLLDLDLARIRMSPRRTRLRAARVSERGSARRMIDGVIGVAKVYTTRVGAGVFPNRTAGRNRALYPRTGARVWHDNGTPARCGWLDTMILRYAVQVNGLSCLALGHLDVLAGLDEVKICVGYETTSGERLEDLPSDLPFRTDIKAVYETLPGWPEDLSDARTVDDLPANARAFVNRVQELAGIPIATVSVGPAREQTIILDGVLASVLRKS